MANISVKSSEPEPQEVSASPTPQYVYFVPTVGPVKAASAEAAGTKANKQRNGKKS